MESIILELRSASALINALGQTYDLPDEEHYLAHRAVDDIIRSVIEKLEKEE